MPIAGRFYSRRLKRRCQAFCCQIESGETITGKEAVQDIYGFQYLLQQYLIWEVSLASQMMMIEATSAVSMHTLMETKIADQAMVCEYVAPFLLSNLGFEDENHEIGLRLDMSSSTQRATIPSL